MGIFGNLFNGTAKLTTTDRKTIWKLFGSFHANKLGQDNSAALREGYEGNVDVYALIKKIMDTYKAVPTIVEQRQSDGTWEQIFDTTIHELMANPNMGKQYTWDDIEEMRALYLLANGNSYMSGQDGLTTLIKEVDVLPSQNVSILTSKDFFMPDTSYKFELGTQKRDFDTDTLQHTRLFNPLFSTVQESIEGLSPIQVASRVVVDGNSTWEASSALKQNRGAIGLITDKSGRPMTPDEAAKVQADFDGQTTGAHNNGKVKVTNKDLDYIKMVMSPTDLKLVESGVINLRALCNIWGLDSSLFNDPANKTYNNRIEAEKALYSNVIVPLANRIDAKDTMFIAQNHFPDGKVRMRKDFSEVEALQADKKTEAEKDKIVMEGVSTVLNMPITPQAKELLLVNEWGYSEEDAKVIATPIIAFKPPVQNFQND